MKSDISQKEMVRMWIAEHSGISSYELEKMAITNGIQGDTATRRARELRKGNSPLVRSLEDEDGVLRWYPVEVEPKQLSLLGTI